ncbi:hypothetical protein HPB47_026822 [Ixodes persulcatus]|uniref:Uncharacterized protein n=1 Tax=Ixodes persulcatus TaxID=34615 RepID=A0AC60PXP5_IXOPE|nr:hypothetical protein HPB47_026822 [Ixodes persulcatus]
MSKKKLGIQNLLYEELLESDPVGYRRMLRVNFNQFADILSSIASCIQKLDTEMRPAIPAKGKIRLTLRFLGSGGTPSRTEQPDCQSQDLDRSASHPSLWETAPSPCL